MGVLAASQFLRAIYKIGFFQVIREDWTETDFASQSYCREEKNPVLQKIS